MKQFLLIFRENKEKDIQLSPEQMQNMSKPWQDWIGAISAQDRLVERGNRLDSTGSVLKSDNIVTDGPYVEMKEAIGGYTIIKASDMDEANELAKGCPALSNGSVEVRPIVPMN